MARTQRIAHLLALVTTAGLGLAAVLGVFAHVDSDPGLSPVSVTISDYAVSDRGGAMDVAILLLAVASATLIAGLRAVSAHLRGWPTALLTAWVVGLLICVVVPTDPVGAPETTTAGYIHRYASGLAFISLPAAATMLATRFTRDHRWAGAVAGVRRLVVASGAGAVALFYLAFFGGRVMVGLVERVLVIAEVGLVTALALALLKVTTAPATPVAPAAQRALAGQLSRQ